MDYSSDGLNWLHYTEPGESNRVYSSKNQSLFSTITFLSHIDLKSLIDEALRAN